ncbi:MAG: aldo/keto reductase [Sulfuritalea sp.]|jgi:diketogulonate reductase-like aldo/keto reductase|nr:aldo/keto reductase [Sulfuritalea sp.]
MPSRRNFLQHTIALSGLAMMSPLAHAAAPSPATRIIPADGRRLAVVGLGTWQTFDVGTNAAARDNLGKLLSRFVELGGEVIDSSPMYGSSESVVGDLVSERKLRERLFFATKVWTSGKAAGIAQMEESLRRLKSPRIELMQIHNLQDWKLHLPVLREWKAAERIRYLGITHYSRGAYAEIEDILRTEPLDFLQINYSLAEQESARRLLPLAAEHGVAVIANQPFAAGALFSRVKDRTLPAAAADHGCRSWAQLFLRWILAHSAVTCAIPASNRIEHLEDNMAAGMGALPGFEEQKALARMAGF